MRPLPKWITVLLVLGLFGALAWFAGCKPGPQPPPPVTTTTTTVATLPPPCLTEADLIPAEPQRPPLLRDVVLAAERRLDVSGCPLATAEACADDALGVLAMELRANGYCAIAGGESVFIKAGDGLVEEYHAYSFAARNWSLRDQYVGCHAVIGR